MNNSDALERLSTIFCLLQTQGQDATIEGISEALNIPINVIREDIQSILQVETFTSLFNIDDDSLFDDDDDDFFDEEIESSNSKRTSKRVIYNKKLLSLLTDDKPLYLDSNDFYSDDKHPPLYITHREKQLLEQYFPDLLKSSKENLYMTKESPAVLDLNAIKNTDFINTIQDAIHYHEYVSFSYTKVKDNIRNDYLLAPKLLYHDINKGRMYMITISEKEEIIAFRLDRMSGVTRNKKLHDETPIPEKILSKFDYLWSMDTSTSDEPIHVKIRVEVYNRNIYEKIQNDISRRKYAKFYQDGDYWYFEDDIIGITSFRSWIYQFGSAMVVMEPVSLAHDVYNAALTRLEKYMGEQ